MFGGIVYRSIKEKTWKTLGIKKLEERDKFLLELLVDNRETFLPSETNTCSIDIGCGTGNLTTQISEEFNLKTIGIDLDKRFISNNKVDFLNASACLLPVKPKSLVCVFAFSLIEHINKNIRQIFLNEVKRALVDDGTLVIQIPNRYFPIEQHSFLPFVGYLPSNLHRLFFYDYLSVPSKNETVGELNRRGFKIVTIPPQYY